MNTELSLEEQFLISLIRVLPDSRAVIVSHLESPWPMQEQLSSEDRMRPEKAV